uniref:Uncharacterized protein n=1 Tax=Streptomyces phage Scarif TaxID=3158858 RepID=A0AAU7GYJ6_9CAUD
MERMAGLPHVTREQMDALADLLENDHSMYEEFYTLVMCGLEDHQKNPVSADEVAEKVATCLLLITKGAL